jgi:N-acetylglucosaminyldiphosphoundecaprenol N-acetyl-beta-D-mannosaminyltransferase
MTLDMEWVDASSPANAIHTHVRCNVLGVGVSAINMPIAVAQIDNWIRQRKDFHYICVTGVHGVMESQHNQTLRGIHNAADMVTPDGMPLVWISKLKGFGKVDRVYGPDLMLALCERNYRHFFYGGAEGTAELLAARMKHRFPHLLVCGCHAPPFRELTFNEDQHIVEQINTTKPDIVWVGLSTPKQEFWMADHVARVDAPVMIGVGAAFDFLAGLKPQAPRWVQRSGFEWLFRLLTEPRRLWRRYLKNNPAFVALSLAQLSGLRLKRWEID